ncbi:MAG TPA: HDOD domain-containing protein [Nitrospiraceae bacterium]|jgi:putative nucleotidyltransferase with HDIG domain|nr:HDOD domain-containing protein [Nitrospiraceae bacterium]
MTIGTDHPAIADSMQQVECELVRRIESGAVDLPLLPQVASRIMALIHDPSADAARLSALIHQDQALAAHVLRIANSPAYMPRTPIVSLQHAVAMLGLTLLSEIAFTASLKAGAYQVPGHEADVKQLWKHALGSGAYAKEIARLRRHNVESAYLCGLLHAIGKPVVLKTVAEVSKQLHTPLEREAVMTLLEGYHVRVGTLIAEKWGLPKQVAEAIAYSACYEHAPTFRQEVMITCLADRLATYLLVPKAFDNHSVRDHPVFADLNLYPNDVDTLLAAKDQILAVVEAMAV